MAKMSTNMILIFLGITLMTNSGVVQSNGEDTKGETSGSTALSAVSNIGKLMGEVISVVDASTLVSLAITNNSPNTELSNPQWFLKPGTTMDTPPPYSMKKEETMIITIIGPKVAGISLKNLDISFGTEGFVSFKFGENKWLVVVFSVRPATANRYLAEVQNADPFAATDRRQTFKTLIGKAHEADKYGSWQSKGADKKIVYCMGGANKAPFQVFVG